MYLKRVEIQGFKSFAEKTKVKFEEGVTVIVGPNGTGKSNITDAIRWVLGEQSVKSLRGSKMEDVIFSGSKGRKPSKMAEVSIILDNSKRIFPIDFEELAISRRVFRTGESEYYINRASCKLKDIRELLMDTGIGKDGYSIIGQGQVDKILSSKSEDRRNIFEEAAGIVKYKSRREESEKKLEKTKSNMLRIEDILTEIKGQVIPLEKQSENAIKYIELKENLKDLEVDYIYKKAKESAENKLSYINEKRELEEKERLNVKESEFLKKNIDLIKNYVANISKRIVEIEEKNIFKLRNKDENINNIGILKNDLQNIEENINKEKIYITQNNEKTEKYRRELEIIDSKIEKTKILLEEKTVEKTEIEIEYETKKSDKLENEKVLSKEKDEVFYMLNKSSEIKSSINNIKSFQDKLKEQNIYFRKEIDEVDVRIEKINNFKKENNEKTLYLEKQYIHQEKDLLQLKEIYTENIENIDNLKNTSNRSHINKKGKESELKLLKDFKNRYEGYNKGVKEFLNYCKNNNLYERGIEGVLGELISVNKEYEKSIEISLGYGIQSIIVENPSVAKKSIELLKKNKLGRITFLPISTIESRELTGKEKEVVKETGVLGIASEIVECNKKYRNIIEYFLGRVIIVDNMDTMIKITKDKNVKYKIITLDGDVYSPGGSMTGGESKNNKTSFLGRDREIKELEENILHLDNLIENTEKELFSIREKLRVTEENIQSKTIDLEKINREKEKIVNLEREHITELKSLEERKNKALLEIDKIDNEVEKLYLDYSKNNIELDSLEKELEELKSNVEKTSKHIDIKETDLEELKNKLQEKELENLTTGQGLKNTEKEKEKTIVEIENLEKFIVYNKKNIENLEKNKVEINKKISEIEEKTKILSLDIEKGLNILEKIKIVRKKEENKLEESSNRRSYLMEKEFETKSKIINIESKIEKITLKIDNYIEHISDEYNISYIDLSIPTKTTFKKENIENEIKTIKRKLTIIGNVNVDSIKEYKILKERYEFLKKQKEDLEKSEISLKKVILELNKKMKTEFLDKFNNIRKEFKTIFQELFGGGEGDIFLNDEEDVLNTGIEIIAQPPGKSKKPLSLLSGGERALTAIAVLFSILKIKPTPFCILDEIESALDEANVHRYGSFLKDFSKNTQFIVVTHRKGTMEAGDILYGVTMELEGVSKIISVKLSEEFIEKLN